MSGKIEVEIRIGHSKNPLLVGYPYWGLVITDETSGKEVRVAPSWNDLKEVMRDIKVHEVRTDKSIKRKNDADRWQKSIEEASKEAQRRLEDFKIPEIYTKLFEAKPVIIDFLDGEKVEEEKLKLLDLHCNFHLNMRRNPMYGTLKELFEEYQRKRNDEKTN